MSTEENLELLTRFVECELQFRDDLVAALDRLGYRVASAKSDEKREKRALREKYAGGQGRASPLWRLLFVHSKDLSAPLCLSVWFSSDGPTPASFKWRGLGLDGMSVAGPSRRLIRDGVTWRENTPPLCYHLLIIDARLRFRALPLPVLRDTLLGGRLAEELAGNVALAFEHIRAIRAG